MEMKNFGLSVLLNLGDVKSEVLIEVHSTGTNAQHVLRNIRASYCSKKKSLHSPHQPKCGVWEKHCKSFESLREHICREHDHAHWAFPDHNPKADCLFKDLEKNEAVVFAWKFLIAQTYLMSIRKIKVSRSLVPLGTIRTALYNPVTDVLGRSSQSPDRGRIEAVAIDCEVVGGGTDGTLDICARVCLIDEEEKNTFHT
ncbi:LOW QUALITY PROTEIN: hypothetical protein RJ641_033992 [Dillenia turbinata]|uniref:Uncharacterized protein n=1 Tax=Dillenia turbinata TaxID=194707 RepID=A0AAN8ZGL5_9MAGN